MNTILIILLVALFIGIIAIALVKGGKIQDTDGDLIPDVVEEKIEKAQKVVKETKRRVKNVVKESKEVVSAVKKLAKESKDVIEAAKGNPTKTKKRTPKQK
jgi:sRNA-binding protein